MRLRRVDVLAGAILAVPLLLFGCKQQNHYAAPPPPEVGVATPLRKDVTLYLDLTGNVVSINEVDLVARVPGFLSEINYKDGAYVTKGANLFVIEPAPYQAKQQQAQGQLQAANAELVQAQAEFVRQSELASQNFASQSKLDVARAKRDSDQAIVQQDEANLAVAAINLSYTRVNAPFDGVVTTHLEAVGALVGQTGPTKLASIISLEPIYVTFNIAEQDVLRIRAAMRAKGLTLAKLGQVPIDVGLANETGYPHHGVLDYVSPNVDAATGTLMVRARFANPDHELLPGFFVRVRVPEGKLDNALLIPDTAWGTDQQGSYVLVVGAGNKVEQRRVTLGQQQGTLRIVTAGLEPSDKVIVDGNSRAIPGQVVAPKAAMIAEASTAAR